MSGNFIDMIIERCDKTPVIIDEILNSTGPLVLYGAGDVSSSIFRTYEGRLNFDYVAVDDEYFIDGKTFHGIRIYPISNLLEKNQKYNFVIGFSDIYARGDQLSALGHKVFYLDPTPPVRGKRAECDFNFVKNYSSVFNMLYDKLEDDLSKSVMVAYINQMISGDCKYLKELLRPNTYFIEDIMKLSNDEVFIDGGAFDGDTVTEFTKFGQGKIYAFEPEPENFRKLLESGKNISDITCINKGLWNEPTTLYFDLYDDSPSASSVREEETGGREGKGIRVEVDSIDNALKGDRATFIKMDIEGAELMALKGGENTIKKYKPKLAICVYHKRDDLLTIPQYIQSINDSYKFYLRIHSPFTAELVLYAI